MPSRVFPPETRQDETSTTSTSPSYQSASPGLEGGEVALERQPNKSGVHHRRSQSLAEDASHQPSSTAARPHHREASTPSRPGPKPINSQAQNHQRPTSSPSSLQASADQRPPSSASYFVRQPGASASDARSPFTRRAPASRSSHGIETLSGPPPALSTQRSYIADSRWKSSPPVNTDIPRSKSFAPDHQSKSASPTKISTGDLPPERLKESEEMASTKRLRDEYTIDDAQYEDTLRGSQISQSTQSKYRSSGGTEQPENQSQSSEDLFLNLAHADFAAYGGHANQKQRRRVSKYFSC